MAFIWNMHTGASTTAEITSQCHPLHPRGLQAWHAESIRAGLGPFFFFYRSGSGRTRAHLAYLLLLCPYTRRAHMATVWITDYIINITHRLRITQRIFARISIQVTVDHAEHQGEVGAWLLKVPNASGKAAFWIIHAFDDPDSPSPHWMRL